MYNYIYIGIFSHRQSHLAVIEIIALQLQTKKIGNYCIYLI